MKQPLSITLAESPFLPDKIARAGIRHLCQKRLNQEFSDDVERAAERYQQVLNDLRSSQLAIETDKANAQHYELPTAFFQAVLGPRLKYSASFFTDGDNLATAENQSLKIYSERAKLNDGQHILELGCGWGSFTLWMAEKYPTASITAVSNSNSQRLHIMAQAEAKGFKNVNVITQDVNQLTFAEGSFDRVVSVEMFEHVRNYEQLFKNISRWLKNDGLLWCHIFCHRFLQYPFEVQDEDDWMSAHFFTGGMMPAISTFSHFQNDLSLEQAWQWSGQHYEKTSNAWLENMDKNKKKLKPIFKEIYGKDARIWWQRWRLFFMACAELFGYDQGNQWLVGHYRFVKR
jgi:cyclopropane-fatty-acyl-phospholipid synthase